MTKKEPLLEREIIDGKPFGGLWGGVGFHVHYLEFDDLKGLGKVKQLINCRKKDLEEEGFILKYFQIIERSPQECNIGNPLGMSGFYGFKALFWGRAYKVRKEMHQPNRFFKKGYKKVWLNGQRRKVKR